MVFKTVFAQLYSIFWVMKKLPKILESYYDCYINNQSYLYILGHQQLQDKSLVEPYEDTWIITEKLARWFGENTEMFDTQVTLYEDPQTQALSLIIHPMFKKDFNTLCNNFTNDNNN